MVVILIKPPSSFNQKKNKILYPLNGNSILKKYIHVADANQHQAQPASPIIGQDLSIKCARACGSF